MQFFNLQNESKKNKKKIVQTKQWRKTLGKDIAAEETLPPKTLKQRNYDKHHQARYIFP